MDGGNGCRQAAEFIGNTVLTPSPEVRTYNVTDLDGVMAVFRAAVSQLAAADYTELEVEAWLARGGDRVAWQRRMRTGGVFVCERDGCIVGFVRIERGGYLDLLFVHPSAVRRGVATALAVAAVEWARRSGARCITADVSITARPWFEARGFCVVSEQWTALGRATLKNFRMECALPLGSD
jgi:putative acetyltransferase